MSVSEESDLSSLESEVEENVKSRGSRQGE